MKKKKWMKPKLIVIVRARLEEASLAGCKHLGVPGGMHQSNLQHCHIIFTCINCNSQAPS